MTSVDLPPILPDLRLTLQHIAPGILHRLCGSGQRADIPLHVVLPDRSAEGQLVFPTRVNVDCLLYTGISELWIRSPGQTELGMTVLEGPVRLPWLK